MDKQKERFDKYLDEDKKLLEKLELYERLFKMFQLVEEQKNYIRFYKASAFIIQLLKMNSMESKRTFELFEEDIRNNERQYFLTKTSVIDKFKHGKKIVEVAVCDAVENPHQPKKHMYLFNVHQCRALEEFYEIKEENN